MNCKILNSADLSPDRLNSKKSVPFYTHVRDALVCNRVTHQSYDTITVGSQSTGYVGYIHSGVKRSGKQRKKTLKTELSLSLIHI